MTFAALLGVLLASAHSGTEPPGAPAKDSAWALTGKARVVEARHALVVSGSPIASWVGRQILRRGGNAMDAAVAVGFALAVVHPEAGNLGGGGYMLIRLADGRVRSLDFREKAPAAASHDMFLHAREEYGDPALTGHLSVAVPGSVAGLLEAHRQLGHLPLKDLLAPAIQLARWGFKLDRYRARSLANATERLEHFEASRNTFLGKGKPPKEGAVFRQEDLATTLEAIRDSGAAGFYRGRVSDLIVAEMARGGGLVTHADLESYQPLWREPIEVRYRGYRVLAPPPSSSGGITLGEMLHMMERTETLPPIGSPALIHLEAEVMRRAFLDRYRYLGDPDFVSIPVDQLLSFAHADSLRRGIDPARATPTPPHQALKDGPATTHYSIVDSRGNAVSCTTTLNDLYGSAVTVAGAGFLLNDTMDDFAVSPGRPNLFGLVQGEVNAIAPGKRPLSSMTPTIVLDSAGRTFLLLGTAGGSRIATMVYHVISNIVDHHLTLPDAVTAPRTHHQAVPDEIQIEPKGVPDSVVKDLQRMGHQVRFREFVFGDVEAIIRLRKGWQGVSDPRRGGGGRGD